MEGSGIYVKGGFKTKIAMKILFRNFVFLLMINVLFLVSTGCTNKGKQLRVLIFYKVC